MLNQSLKNWKISRSHSLCWGKKFSEKKWAHRPPLRKIGSFSKILRLNPAHSLRNPGRIFQNREFQESCQILVRILLQILAIPACTLNIKHDPFQDFSLNTRYIILSKFTKSLIKNMLKTIRADFSKTLSGSLKTYIKLPHWHF